MIASRGNALVKMVETSETLSGGLIVIPQAARERYAANQYEVVSVGLPEICEAYEDCDRRHTDTWNPDRGWEFVHQIPRILTEGAWVLIEPRSLIDAGNGQYFIRQDDVAAVFVEGEKEPKA